ncbi:MAG TPA: elongation factor P maturation arginine rhamnosyltransferase EarP [Burkholderiaceae bacterium]|nr:elongation factor P maturation arginine rhamnosyltransferase EarP [Burkholderiaceae bacterium]
MLWDVFCRVVDHHGDLGVCWRLAADLASRGERVRLWVDDPLALAWMAPEGAAGVAVIRWAHPLPVLEPGDVVVEAFGCDPPPAFVTRMGARAVAPVWINLEYLTAEPYAERSHGLRSPQQVGPGAGLVKWFFFPGFTPASGGLLRGRIAGEAPRWSDWGVQPRDGERRVSLFCYAHAPFDELFRRLAGEPTLLLVAAGAGQAPALERLDARPRANLRVHALPWLTQPDYDRLLAACDLNFARGEDSIVRAMWAGAPFVWHIYRQDDGAHAAKLDALLDRMAAPPELRALWRAWNDLGPWPDALPDDEAWRRHASRWRDGLLAQTDLTGRLMAFVAAKR